jgi:DNA-binding transcriptional LysR family regulator
VRSVDSEGAQLVTQKLREARWVLAGSAELVGRLGTLKHWEDAPWISWDDALGARVGAARWLRTTVPHANRVLTTSHFAAQLAAAERGVGVVLLAEPYLSLRRLVRVPLHARLKPAAARWPVDRVWLVTHRTLRRVPRVAAVWDTLRDALLARGPEVW